MPSEADGWWYFLLRKANWPTHRVVRVRPGGGLADVRTVVDPDMFLVGGTISGWQMVGSKVLVGITDGTEYGPLRIIDPETRQPVGEPFGQSRVFAAAYQKAEAGQPDRLYHGEMSAEAFDADRYVMVRERPFDADPSPHSVRVELAPPAWGSLWTFRSALSVQTDGDDRWLVVTETQGIGQLHRTSVYDLKTQADRPRRVAYMDNSASSNAVQIHESWAYFLSTDNGSRPYGALFRAPVRSLGERRTWQTVLPGDGARQSHLIGFSLETEGTNVTVTATRRHHGKDHITVHSLRETTNGPEVDEVTRLLNSRRTPFAALGGAKELAGPEEGTKQRLVSWVDVGGPRVWVHASEAGQEASPQEWAVSRDLREAGPQPTATVTRDIPFSFGTQEHQTGVVRLTVPTAELAAGGPPTVVMRDAYPYYGYVQIGVQAGTTLYDHMLDDSVHAAGGATAVVYHDHPRGGSDAAAELPWLLIGAAETLVDRGAAEPGRVIPIGGSAQAYAASEAVRLRPDLFRVAAIRSGMLRMDEQGLSGGVGICQVGPQAFGPDPQAVCAYRGMREEGIVPRPGARRPVLLLSYATQDTRTRHQDHTLPYAEAARAAGAIVHLNEFPGGHVMQWARPYGGGAGAFAQQLSQAEAIVGGLGAHRRPGRWESAIAVAAGLGPVMPLPAPASYHMDEAIGPPALAEERAT
ncbi:MAG: hypothetical protein HOV68_13990, partial [Streptomycetaceae bacterium]|nr:hypothetical protein [Streptomycetaceae bacterium]